MLKRDPIFWWAAGIFVLSLVLAGLFQNQFWLALMIVSYLLRPTLASLGFAHRYVDERQLSIQYRSGNVGFAVMLIVCVIYMVKLGAEDNHDFEFFASTIIIGLAAKALFNVIVARRFRHAASTILIAAGLLIALFAAMDAGSFVGTLVSIAPGLAIAGLGLLARKYPRPAGVVVLCLTVFFMVMILSRITWGQIVTAILIGVPMILAGLALILPEKADTDTPSDRGA